MLKILKETIDSKVIINPRYKVVFIKDRDLCYCLNIRIFLDRNLRPLSKVETETVIDWHVETCGREIKFFSQSYTGNDIIPMSFETKKLYFKSSSFKNLYMVDDPIETV